ncbi:hypothetical protein B0J14DRAFT_18259 [Halenospora varia]|nr:hypothetical protein B0J14DRAFT_18259 [Halenospora varia]
MPSRAAASQTGSFQPLYHDIFPKFLSLPVELRLKIWRYAMPPPAPICLDRPPIKAFTVSQRERVSWVAVCNDIQRRKGLPSMLSVSRESRAEMLSCYRVVIDEMKRCGTTLVSRKALCFNPEVDFFYVSHRQYRFVLMDTDSTRYHNTHTSCDASESCSHDYFDFYDQKSTIPQYTSYLSSCLTGVRDLEIRDVVRPSGSGGLRDSIIDQAFRQAIVNTPSIERLHFVFQPRWCPCSPAICNCPQGALPAPLGRFKAAQEQLFSDFTDAGRRSFPVEIFVYNPQPVGAWRSSRRSSQKATPVGFENRLASLTISDPGVQTPRNR